MYIKSDRLFTPFQQQGTYWLEINHGKIQSIQKSPPSLGEILDLSGLILTPGWIDLQINGAYGVDFTETPQNIWQVTENLPRLGITTCLPTIITSPQSTVNEAMTTWQAGSPSGYRGSYVPGLHIEGPFLNPQKKGAHRAEWLVSPDLIRVSTWKQELGVKLVTLAPELTGALEVTRQLTENGVVVSAGHSLADYAQALAGFSAGITFGTHLFNAMPPLDHRQPGLVGALLTHDEIKTGLIIDGIHVAPPMVNFAWRLKGSRGIVSVTDAMAALGQPPGEYQLAGSRVIVNEKDARLVDGTLAGSILTPRNALVNLIEYTGCTFEEALFTWTTNPAELVSIPDRGQIRPGYAADLVILNNDYTIQMVMVNGEIVTP